MDEDLSLEDKLAWRRKISSVDASLRSALEDNSVSKSRFALLSRKKEPKAKEPEVKTGTSTEKSASNGFQLGIDNAGT